MGKIVQQRYVNRFHQSMRLARITVQVENLLRGSVDGRTTIDFYNYAPYFLGTTGPVSFPRTGRRYVLALTRDKSGLLRPVWDYWDSSELVASGRHRTVPLDSSRTVEQRIATLLLTPTTEDFDIDLFAAEMDGSAGFARLILGVPAVIAFYQQQMNSPHLAIRIAACENLTSDFAGLFDCWDPATVGDGSLLLQRYGRIPPQVSRRAHRYQQREIANLEGIWASRAAAGRVDDWVDQLDVYSLAPDAELRRRACRLLRKYHPNRPSPQCP
ncbi:hypothetical protein F183_A34340 [Bryobacterales bacterium F-183]|nr:hypothetical protein F183_A34340 [Bryobacterales bacterium F-183]